MITLYPYWLPPGAKYVSWQNKIAQAIIDFDDHISSYVRRKHKSLYRNKYADELKKRFINSSVILNPEQAVVRLKYQFLEGVGAKVFPSDKKIKNKHSSLKRAFQESSEHI